MKHAVPIARFVHVASPLGPLTVLEGPRGLLRLDFGRTSTKALLDAARSALGPVATVVRDAKLPAAREVTEYLAGRRRTFSVRVDLAGVAPFERRVLRALCRVPFGSLVTYGELARRVGCGRGAARAVGGAMRKNPMPIVVPCHRVVAADGTLGGYSAGLRVKRELHAMEGIGPLTGGWIPSRRPGRARKPRSAARRVPLAI